MKREEIDKIQDDWDLIIDMPLDGDITNRTGLYTQSGGPSSWVNDPDDNTRKVALFNTKTSGVFPDNNFQLRQDVYSGKFKLSLDWYQTQYSGGGTYKHHIDSCYGGGWQSYGGLGIHFQLVNNNTYGFGISGKASDLNLQVSKNLIPAQTWFNCFIQHYNDYLDVVITNLETNQIVAEKHGAITTEVALDLNESRTKIRLGTNNRWRDDRSSYAYLRNFKMWLHK